MNHEVSVWFLGEVMHWRYVSSILWTILIQLVGVTGAFLFTKFVFSTQVGLLSVAFHYFISVCLTVIFAVLHINMFTVVPRNALSVLEVGKTWLSRWFHVVVFTVLGTFGINCLGSLFASFSLYEQTTMCETASINCCLNEKHLFNTLHGAFFSLIFGCSYFFNGRHTLEFPPIEQLKFPTGKAKVREVIMHSAGTVFKHMKWFYLLYFLFGNFFKRFFGTVTRHPFCNGTSLTSFSGLLNLHLLWITWISAAVLCVVWSSFIALFQIFMTEHYPFEIETFLEKDTHKTLNTVLQSNTLPIMQYLAWHDFSHLSRHSATRRSKLFHISNPGGHPLQWNAICSNSLKLVDKFLLELVDITSGVTTCNGNNVKHTELEKKMPKMPSLSKSFARDDSIPGIQRESATSFSSPAAYRRPFLKNLASPVQIPDQTFVSKDRPHVYANIYPVNFPSISNWLSTKVSQLVEKTKRHPFVKYFITETPEAKMERLFLTSQPIIWVIQGICYMVRASLHEDKYGVVQRWLPDIISKLLDLQSALDRAQKTSTKKPNQLMKGTQLRQTLRVALSTGLYCIVCTFKQHLGNIKLADEHRQRLLQYENFMV